MNSTLLKGIATILAALCAVLPHALPALAPYAELLTGATGLLMGWAHLPQPGAKAAS